MYINAICIYIVKCITIVTTQGCWCSSGGQLRKQVIPSTRAGRSGGRACAPGEPSCRAPHSQRGNQPVIRGFAEAATPAADVNVAKQQPMPAPVTRSVRHEVSQADWTPWLLFGRAGLAALYVFGTPQQHPEAARSVSSGASRSP